mmetsp:Transcript_11086/g.27666  ORF Transcript_11086/g.27666 Transcript_11086/m.27666 type:complete len:1003 (+) Transcript_11086:172-3180(+)
MRRGSSQDVQNKEEEEAEGERKPLLPKIGRQQRHFTIPEEEQDPEAQQGATLTEFAAPPKALARQGSELPFQGTLRRSCTTSLSDGRKAFVERLLTCAGLQDDKLDSRSLAKGRQKLLDVLEGRPMTGGCDEELPNIMMYKGRPLFSARIVHFAVWCSAQLCEASLLELVLKCMGEREPFHKAKYELRSWQPGWRNELRLDPLHIACGLGCLPAVEALVKHAAGGEAVGTSPGTRTNNQPLRDYVNIYTVQYHQQIDDPTNYKIQNFYLPIHEATALGFIDVALYLLQQGAVGSVANLDGVYPLHFLAHQGSAGGIRTGMTANESSNLRKVVRALQDSGGSLEARVSQKHYNPNWAGKMPLELAALADSRFPRHLMGLLVPCLQDDSVGEPRFFADVSFLTRLDKDAATDVVREVSDRAAHNNSVLQRFRLDAQKEGRTDTIAGILFLAPEAGGTMLEMLVGDPVVKDVSKHNIPTRTSLYGFWRHLPMRCIYRGDAEKRDNVLSPVWNFETDKTFEKQPEIAWHRWLVPETTGLALRTDYVYNVQVSTVLLPNILDLDMFLALARVLRPEMDVFSKRPVQGMIYCMWNNLVEHVWAADLCYQLAELFVLMWWSLAWPVYGPRGAITSDEPFCWAVIVAGIIREAIQTAAGVSSFIAKFKTHTDATLKSLWHPLSGILVTWAGSKMLIMMVQTRFAMGSRLHLDDSELSDLDQIFLAIIVLVKATQVTYMFRLCTGGSKIYAIFYSFLGGATREMISITAMIFGSFSLSFMVLAKDKAAGWVIASSYRGLLFGDGDGFNNLGMDVHEGSYGNNDTTLMVFLVMGSFFFNIILLNLIIAVYGNEYDKVASETPMLFAHGRAKNIVMYILSCQLFPWMGENFNVTLRVLAACLAVAGVAYHASRLEAKGDLMTAILLAGAQLLFQAAMAQCHWFSLEGIAADGKEHFLWMCYREMKEECEQEALQVGQFEQRLLAMQKHVDSRIGCLEEKLETILDRLDSFSGG